VGYSTVCALICRAAVIQTKLQGLGGGYSSELKWNGRFMMHLRILQIMINATYYIQVITHIRLGVGAAEWQKVGKQGRDNSINNLAYHPPTINLFPCIFCKPVAKLTSL